MLDKIIINHYHDNILVSKNLIPRFKPLVYTFFRKFFGHSWRNSQLLHILLIVIFPSVGSGKKSC